MGLDFDPSTANVFTGNLSELEDRHPASRPADNDRLYFRSRNGVRKAWRAYCAVCALTGITIGELAWADKAPWTNFLNDDRKCSPFSKKKCSKEIILSERTDKLHSCIYQAITHGIDERATNEFQVAKDFLVDIFLPSYNLCLEINGPQHYLTMNPCRTREYDDNTGRVSNNSVGGLHCKGKDVPPTVPISSTTNDTESLMSLRFPAGLVGNENSLLKKASQDVVNGNSFLKKAVVESQGYKYLALGGSKLPILSKLSMQEMQWHLKSLLEKKELKPLHHERSAAQSMNLR